MTEPVQSQPSSVGLRVIAVGKLLKVLVLVALGVSALASVGRSPPAELEHVASWLRVDPQSRVLHRLIASVSGLETRSLEELGAGSFLYAALFSVEGVGLWFEKRWAEYFTIAITISFVPLEIYEITRRISAPKIVVLLVNLTAASGGP